MLQWFIRFSEFTEFQIHLGKIPFEFSLNVFREFTKFSDKNICHYSKKRSNLPPSHL